MNNPKINRIRKIHREIRFDYLKNESLAIGLEVMILFLILQFITIFLPILQQPIPNTPIPIHYTTSIVVALIYGTARMLVKNKHFRISKIERKLENLDELYATVMELKDVNTLPAIAVQDEFIEKASKTTTYPLFEYKRFFIRGSLVLAVLVLLLLTPLFGSLSAIDTDWAYELFDNSRFKEVFADPDNVTLLSDEGIYGDETTLINGSANLDITLDLSTGGGDYANPLAWQNDVRSSTGRFETLIDAKIDSPAIEELPEEFELAKAYNLKIRQLEQ